MTVKCYRSFIQLTQKPLEEPKSSKTLSQSDKSTKWLSKVLMEAFPDYFWQNKKWEILVENIDDKELSQICLFVTI